jgi:hypothetical protein
MLCRNMTYSNVKVRVFDGVTDSRRCTKSCLNSIPNTNSNISPPVCLEIDVAKSDKSVACLWASAYLVLKPSQASGLLE